MRSPADLQFWFLSWRDYDVMHYCHFYCHFYCKFQTCLKQPSGGGKSFQNLSAHDNTLRPIHLNKDLEWFKMFGEPKPIQIKMFGVVGVANIRQLYPPVGFGFIL